MGYIYAIKEGIKLVHRVWQLVLVQLGMVLISGISFFVFVGIPLAFAFIIFNVDLTGIAQKDILYILKEPSEIISKYFGVALFVIIGLVVYIFAVITFSIYVFGGSVGVIGKVIEDKNLKFSLHLFFSEAKRLFLPMLGFTTLVGIILIVVAFVFGILGGTIVALVSYIKRLDSTLALFISLFFSMILILLLLVMFFGIISITIYGTAALSIKGMGPLGSLKDGFHYIMKHPHAFWLYLILFGIYILISFILILFGYPFKLIPVIGSFISFPYQLISYVFQTYVGLIIIAVIFIYYYFTEIHKEPVVENSASRDPLKDGKNG
ncbi:MAG: hypothetical protein ACPL1G_08835 [Thermodesulfovibrionales bacterium]